MLGWDWTQASSAVVRDKSRPAGRRPQPRATRRVLDDPTAVHSARHRLPRGDGTARPLEINVVGRSRTAGSTAINGVARDISERTGCSATSSAPRSATGSSSSKSPDIVFSTDAEGRFTFLSEAIERMTDYRSEELIGQHFSVLVDRRAGRSLPIAGRPRRATRARVQAELILRRPGRSPTPVDVRAIGVAVDGVFAGIQGATRDVSDQVRLEGELRRQAGSWPRGRSGRTWRASCTTRSRRRSSR